MMAIGRSENPACGKHYVVRLGLVLAVDQRAVVELFETQGSEQLNSAAVGIGLHTGCYGQREGIALTLMLWKLQITYPKLCVSMSVYRYGIVIRTQMYIYIDKEMQMVINIILEHTDTSNECTLIYRISL